MDCKIFTDLIKLLRNIIEKRHNGRQQIAQRCSTIVINNKFLYIGEAHTIEDVLYKKFVNGGLHR